MPVQEEMLAPERCLPGREGLTGPRSAPQNLSVMHWGIMTSGSRSWRRWSGRGVSSADSVGAGLLKLAIAAGLLANVLPTHEAGNHARCPGVAESVLVAPCTGQSGDTGHGATPAADATQHACCPVHCPAQTPGLSGSPSDYPSPDPLSVVLLSLAEQAPDLMVVLPFDHPPCLPA